MFSWKKKQKMEYDPQTQEPAVRRSICTGEMSAGFIDRQSGRFREVMRLRDQKELEAFRKSVGGGDVRMIY